MLKGKTKIELFNNGEMVNTFHDNNMVTNIFSNIIDYVEQSLEYNTIYNRDTDGSVVGHCNYLFGGKDSMIQISKMGLVLYDKNLPEDAEIYTSKYKPIGYGSRVSSTGKNYMGTLNTLESKDILDEITNTKIGYRFVWDFSTSSCNTTIKALSLTNEYLTDSSNTSNYFLGNVTHEYQNANNYAKKCTVSFDSKGCSYVSMNDRIKKLISSGVSILNTSLGQLNNYKEFVFDNLKSISRCIIDNDIIIFLASDSNDDTCLIKYDIVSETILEKTIVSSLNGINYIDFGLCGKYLLVINTFNKVFYVDLSSSDKLIMEKTLPSATDSHSRHLFFSNYKCSEEEYCCDVSYSTDNYTPYHHRYLEIYEKEDGSDIEFGYPVVVNSRDAFSLEYPINSKPFGICSDTGFRQDTKLRYRLGVSKRALFTINNLEQPIDKTEANTMKITYELRWGE